MADEPKKNSAAPLGGVPQGGVPDPGAALPLSWAGLKDLFTDFFQEFKQPYAWLLLLAGFVFATKGLELVRSLKGHAPIFAFLKPVFAELGGVFRYDVERYLQTIPAIVYQAVLPFLACWWAVHKGWAPEGMQGATVFRRALSATHLSWAPVRRYARYLLLAFAVMTPVIFVIAQRPEFKAQYPYLSELRKQRKAAEELSLVRGQKQLEVDRAQQAARGADGTVQDSPQVRERAAELAKLGAEARTLFFGSLWLLFAFELLRMLYMASWEFLFRGFLLGVLRERFAWGAVFIQMIPYVLLHSTKPGLELYYTIPSGLLLGALAYKTRSIWPGFLLHFLGAVLFDAFAMFA